MNNALVAPPGFPQQIVTPWMQSQGYTLETPMEVMVAGFDISAAQAAQIDYAHFNNGAPVAAQGLIAAEGFPEETMPSFPPLIPILAGIAGGLIAGGAGAAIGEVAGEVLAAPGTGEEVGHEVIINGVPTGGPGVPEPPKWMIAKAWNVKVDSQTYGTFRMYYFMLTDGRCMSYHSPTKTWKIWKPKKHIVISKDPRVSTLRKLGRLNKRVEKMLKPFQPKLKKGLPARALARTYLSRAERQQLGVGLGIGGK